MLPLRMCANVLFCLLAPAALQGCLLDRVLETRAQLCDEKPSRVVVAQRPGSGMRVVFEKPTLTDRDVVWLVGYEPTRIAGADAVRELSYEAVPLHRPLDRAAGLVVRLSFVRVGSEFRLAEVEIPEKFNAILTPPLLEAAVGIACKAEIGIVPPRTTFDLTPLDRAALPNGVALRRVLGQPAETSSASNAISYRYCLAPCAAKPAAVAHLQFAFDSRDELQRTDASYFRYSLVIDLLAAVATATIELH